tara:strand:+ start:556 stop:1164 length:609 start_codon:yes stop_codon:yes gene_type:complete
MRQKLLILFLFHVLNGHCQLYVAEGTTFSLKGPKTILSSKESLNEFNTSIKGQGVIYLNHSTSQRLISSSLYLELPNIRVKNANLVTLDTRLDIHNKLIVESGKLTLYHEIVLNSSEDLIIDTISNVITTSNGQLTYRAQYSASKSQVLLVTHWESLKYRGPESQFDVLGRLIIYLSHTFAPHLISNNKVDINCDYPPPKII